MTDFLYPITTADFPTIRELGQVYVDKTDMMYDLARQFKYVFLARPRRFGKSLLCSTFKAYFEGRRELFEGLKVMELEKEWKKYPVLHFDMSRLKNCTIAEAKSILEGFLRDYEDIYGKKEGDMTPGARLKSLIHNAKEQTGQNAVVILDEYDSPILRLLYEEENLKAMRTMLREFYQVLKSEDANLRFVFLTGVTKFSQLSIFSELNNLNSISLDDEYSGLCGITQEELDTVLRPCVAQFADNLKISTDEAYAILKKNYDGYHFSPHGRDVYAPFSLLKALSKNVAGYYWFESGTPSSLIEHLKRFPKFNPLEYDGVEMLIDEFNAPCEGAKTPVPLLYQTGYLTIGEYDNVGNLYTLRFPNNEVRYGLVYSLTNYLLDVDDSDRNATIIKIFKALNSGDLSTALLIMRSYIASIPYSIISKKAWAQNQTREDFYKMLMYIIFTMLGNMVDTELKNIIGRADIVIKTRRDIFILELKVDQDVDVALAQINAMGYAVPFAADPRPVTKCGVCISSEQRTLSHWKITDASGNVIEEKVFQNEEK